MSYATTNPPRKVSSGIGNGPNVWHYSSADAKATVNGAGYITNAAAPATNPLGMKVGDVVHIYDTNTPLLSISGVTTISASTGAASLTAMG